MIHIKLLNSKIIPLLKLVHYSEILIYQPNTQTKDSTIESFPCEPHVRHGYPWRRGIRQSRIPRGSQEAESSLIRSGD